MAYAEGVNKGFLEQEKEGVVFYTIPAFTALGVRHGFTSRIGGVSEGEYASLNLSFKREPDSERVRENFRRAAKAIGVPAEQLVLCNYEHGNCVEFIDKRHHGMGIFRENELPACDGVCVTAPGTVAVSLHADCNALFLLDKRKRAAAVCHAGWRGTLLGILNTAVCKMQSLGVLKEEILVGIGPAICGECYEIKEDVAQLFEPEYLQAVLRKGPSIHLDLPSVLLCQLERMEIPPENITLSGLCTYADSEKFYSHRRDRAKTGAMGCFIAL